LPQIAMSKVAYKKTKSNTGPFLGLNRGTPRLTFDITRKEERHQQPPSRPSLYLSQHSPIHMLQAMINKTNYNTDTDDKRKQFQYTNNLDEQGTRHLRLERLRI